MGLWREGEGKAGHMIHQNNEGWGCIHLHEESSNVEQSKKEKKGVSGDEDQEIGAEPRCPYLTALLPY